MINNLNYNKMIVYLILKYLRYIPCITTLYFFPYFFIFGQMPPLLTGAFFYFWAWKKCWSSNSDWLPGETMAGWRRPMKGQPWVTVWTWTFFSSPEIKKWGKYIPYPEWILKSNFPFFAWRKYGNSKLFRM